MTGWLQRARRMSGPERWRRYTVSSLYFFALFEATLVGAWVLNERSEAGPAPFATLTALLAVHLWTQIRVSRTAPFLGGQGPGRTLLAVHTAVTLAMCGTGIGLQASGRIEPAELGPCYIWILMFYAGPVMLALPLRRGAAQAAAVSAAVLTAAVAVGPVGLWAAVTVGVTALGVPFMGLTYRASAWGVKLVDELDAARQAQARLAVAEERLRFGRDLHDVLGRNLAVIALKSELAAQLARRGRPEAADQMVEVQRVARDSQREIRAVVRGYREADLHAELAGARAVLRAAGVECRIDDGAGELPEEIQSALAWVVREGTTNVLRHADAHDCHVSLRARRSAVLVMENDGARLTAAEGSGLAGLRERLAAVGGTLTAGARPGGRFRLAAEIPLEAVR